MCIERSSRVQTTQNEIQLIGLGLVNPTAPGGIQSSGIRVGSGMVAQGLQTSRLESQHDLETSACLPDAFGMADDTAAGEPGPCMRAYLATYDTWRAAKQHELDLQMKWQQSPWQNFGSLGQPAPLHLRVQLDAAMRCARTAQDAMLSAYMELMASREGETV